MITYIYNGVVHSDFSEQYMQSLGMTDENMESVLNQRDFELGQYEAQAIKTRYKHIYSPLAIGKGVLDVGVGKDGVFGIDNLKDTLVAVDLGLDASSGVNWIMADNSVQVLMIEDIQEAIRNFNLRKQEVFEAYGAWRAGDKLTPFSMNKGEV